ncbi:unnamed protein product [Symbiodinium pilosum]|uniref:Uncharacterized protein n=1 Tax=Symbiodinium pilosum TaxID=2952 RepID=A0A812VR02_SYMPI|nr:unnamed protein product [Symbiodinium pilosum]
MWAAFSYSQNVQHTQECSCILSSKLARFWPRIETFAVQSFFPMCWVTQAWGQGYIHVNSGELQTGGVSCPGTMAILGGYTVLLMNYGPLTLEDWRSRISCQTSRRAWNTWKLVFFLACGLRLYAWQAEPSMAVQRGETMHHTFLAIFVLALVYTLVFDCDPTFVSRGRALPAVVFALAVSVMAALASWCSAFKDGKDGGWEMSYARGIMLFLVYVSILSTAMLWDFYNRSFSCDLVRISQAWSGE